MKRIVLVMMLLAGVSTAQTVLFPVGTTRQITKMELLHMSKGIFAEPNLVLGQAAFDACVATNRPNCVSEKDQAMWLDAQDRLYVVVSTLYKGLQAGQTKDQLFTANKIWIEQ